MCAVFLLLSTGLSLSCHPKTIHNIALVSNKTHALAYIKNKKSRNLLFKSWKPRLISVSNKCSISVWKRWYMKDSTQDTPYRTLSSLVFVLFRKILNQKHSITAGHLSSQYEDDVDLFLLFHSWCTFVQAISHITTKIVQWMSIPVFIRICSNIGQC